MVNTNTKLESKEDESGSPLVPLIVIGLLVLGIVVFMFLPGILLVGGMMFGSDQTIQSVQTSEIPRLTAGCLHDLLEIDSGSNSPVRKVHLIDELQTHIKGINGLTESGGLHGDGCDWYEIDISPDLAAALRAEIAKSTTLNAEHPPRQEKYGPKWWPEKWPEDVKSYNNFFVNLSISDKGTRVWIRRIRS